MPHPDARPLERLFGALQTCLPTRLLSTLMHRLAQARVRWLKQALINTFCQLYAPDLSTATEPDRNAYASFNAFFTRALRADARPIAPAADTIVSPVDGTLGAFGCIESGRLFQTKGMAYDLTQLLDGNTDWTREFSGGAFATLYLAPHNYHRVHMPVEGQLRASHYVPGRLFGVNPASVRSVPRLFSRNERMLSVFDTAIGPMALIMVGAFCVGGIDTRWAGRVCPPHRRRGSRPLMPGNDNTTLRRGEEMGRFNLGSSVILLFGPQAVRWPHDTASGQPLTLGRPLAQTLAHSHDRIPEPYA